MADIEKITLPSGTTYDIVDAGARALIANLNSFEYVISKDAGSTPYGITWTKTDGTEVTGTLVASSNTTAKIYLVPKSGSGDDAYNEYITIKSQSGGALAPKVTAGPVNFSKLSQYKLRLEVEETGFVSSTRVSTLTYKLYATKTSGDGYWTTTTYPYNVKFGTTTVKSGNIAYDFRNATPKTITIASGTTTVTRNATGTTEVSFSGTYNASSASIGTATVEGTITLGAVTDTYNWEKFGSTTTDLGDLGNLAYKDSVSGTVAVPNAYTSTFSGTSFNSSGTFTASGTVSQPTFSGTAFTSTGKFTPAGTVSQPTFTGSAMTSTGTFTPSGSNAKSAVTISPTTTDVYSMSSAGSVSAGSSASFSATVTNKTLTLSFTANTPTAVTLPSRSSAIKAWTGYNTGVANTYASAQTFTGTANQSISVSGTPSGTVSQPTFTGTANQSISVSGTATGTVSQPTFTGTANQSISVSGTATGTVTTTTKSTENKTVTSS